MIRWALLTLCLGAACAGDLPEDDIGEATSTLTSVTWTNAVGVTVSGNDLTKSASERLWNAGAASTQTVTGDGHVEFTTAENTTAKMAGLSDGNSGVGDDDIDFAVFLRSDGIVSVRERGEPRGSFGPYAAGDVFRVAISGGVVSYWQNGALLRTSGAIPTFPLLVDASLRTPGATITDAVIESGQFWGALVGAAADRGDLSKTDPADTWKAGAASLVSLNGDGYVEFTTGENTAAKAAGLSNGDGGPGYTDIDFAVFLRADGTVSVREGGETRGSFGPYAAGDVFRVAVSDGEVTYARNGVVFYTSAATPVFPLLVDSSLRTPGATIRGARLATPAIVFDNSDATFVWQWWCGCIDDSPTAAPLDVTRAPDQQGGSSARTITFFKQDSSVGNITPGSFDFLGRTTDPRLHIAASPPFVIPGNEPWANRTVIPPLPKRAGDVVGPADDWQPRVQTAHFQDFSGETGPDRTWFRDGIIGVRFLLNQREHYGFIELDYVGDGTSWMAVYRPVRWGYHPDPDTPLIIPP